MMIVKKKRAKKKSKAGQKTRGRNIVFILFISLGVLILVLGLLLMFDFGVFKKNEVKMFSIKDECSIVVGNLIHQIRNDGECRIKCVNECYIREMDFEKFNFIEKNDDCSSCECWCS